jgi:hypothetical protein
MELELLSEAIKQGPWAACAIALGAAGYKFMGRLIDRFTSHVDATDATLAKVDDTLKDVGASIISLSDAVKTVKGQQDADAQEIVGLLADHSVKLERMCDSLERNK